MPKNTSPLKRLKNEPRKEGASEADVIDLEKKIEKKRIEKKFIVLTLVIICGVIGYNTYFFNFDVWSSSIALVALQGLGIFILAKWFNIGWFDDIVDKYMENKK